MAISAGVGGLTNAISSTNVFVTLFSPPPPVTLNYSSPILYTNEFYGGTWTIDGMPLTAANTLVGGTNTTWWDVLGTNNTGVLMANGFDTAVSGDSWLLPFTPEAGYVYTLTASVTFSANPGSWVGVGFAQTIPTNSAVGFARFTDGGTTPPDAGPEGYDWLIVQYTGNVAIFS